MYCFPAPSLAGPCLHRRDHCQLVESAAGHHRQPGRKRRRVSFNSSLQQQPLATAIAISCLEQLPLPNCLLLFHPVPWTPPHCRAWLSLLAAFRRVCQSARRLFLYLTWRREQRPAGRERLPFPRLTSGRQRTFLAQEAGRAGLQDLHEQRPGGAHHGAWQGRHVHSCDACPFSS